MDQKSGSPAMKRIRQEDRFFMCFISLYMQFFCHQPCFEIRFDDTEGSTVHVQDELVEPFDVKMVSECFLGFLAQGQDLQVSGIVFQVIARII